MNDNEIVEAIKGLMDVWNRLMAEARAMLPDATPEELFRVVYEAMNRSLRRVEANLRRVEENIRRGRVPYFFVGDPPTTWYPSRYAAADDRSFVDIQMALSIDKPATAGYYIYTITNAED